MHTHEVTLPKRRDALAGDVPPAAANPPRLLDEIRRAIRYRHYSYRTEQAYVDRTRRLVRFHAMRHPREMCGDEVVAFLDHLANDRDVAASTHNRRCRRCCFSTATCLATNCPGSATSPARDVRGGCRWSSGATRFTTCRRRWSERTP
jgi:hypothetical protein